MADTQKTIQVNIDVVVNQAKTALNDLSKATKSATESLSKMGGASKEQGAFFDSTTTSILKGIASYDLLKQAGTAVVGFLEDSVKESMNAAAAMAQVKVNVENAGLSYAKIQPQLEAYSKQMIAMGFDDEDTALSVSKLAVVTGSYSDGLKLNQLAMDLARSKNIDLATATALVTQVTQGHGRVLQQYGIQLDDAASAADNLDKLQQKVKGSSEAFSQTAPGKLAMVTQQWNNMKQEIGDSLTPSLIQLTDEFEQNMPQIESMLKGATDSLAKFAGWLITATKGAVGFFDVIGAGIDGGLSAMTQAAAGGSWALEKVGLSSKETTKNIQQLSDDFGQAASDAFDWGLQLNTSTAHADELTKNIETAKTGFQGISAATKDNTKALAEHEQALKDLASGFNAVIGKQNEFSFNSVDDFGRFKNVLVDTKSAQDTWLASAKQGFESFGSAIKALDGNIDTLKGKMTDAKNSFQDFLKSTAQSSGDDFAKIVHDAEESIKMLPQQIKDAQDKMNSDAAGGRDTAGDAKNIADLQKQLADKQAIIKTSQNAEYQSNTEFMAQLQFLRDQDGRNELEQAYAIMQQKITAKKAESDAQIAEIQKQIDEATLQRNAFTAAQTAMTVAFAQNVAIRAKSAKDEVASLDAITAAVQRAAAAYAAFSSTKAGNSVLSGARAEGGPVTGGGSYLVGEKGPEIFTPSSSGRITPNDQIGGAGGATVHININGPVSGSEEIKRVITTALNEFNRASSLRSTAGV